MGCVVNAGVRGLKKACVPFLQHNSVGLSYLAAHVYLIGGAVRCSKLWC